MDGFKDVVLLRVTGRDSTGQVAQERVFCHSDCGKVWYTGSAVSLDEEQSYFCTSAYLLVPFLDPETLQLYDGTTVEVMSDDGKYHWKTVQLEKIIKNHQITRSISHLTNSSPKWTIGWLLEHGESRIESMKQEIDPTRSEKFNSPFFSNISPPTDKQITKSGIDQIAYLKLVDYSGSSTRNNRITTKNDLQQGQSVFVVGTPFGVNSPATFLNSITNGYISNSISPVNSTGEGAADLWLIDAIISPGMEGGAMYTREGGSIYGLTLPPIRRSDDIIAFNLIVPFCHLESGVIPNRPPILPKINHCPCGDTELIKKAKRSVVLLKYGTTWTSGFFISSEGYILTNAHLFGTKRNNKKFGEIQVRCDYPKPGIWKKAKAIFVANSSIDVALLQLTTPAKVESCTVFQGPLKPSSKIFALGHGIWGSRHSLQASVTGGVLSRVVTIEGKESMILTDVAIHKGNSGGMIIDASTGSVIALAAFNATIRKPGEHNSVSMPHLNFSIPISFLLPFFEFCSSKTRDTTTLEQFNNPTEKLISLWNLELGAIDPIVTPLPPKYTEYIQNMTSKL